MIKKVVGKRNDKNFKGKNENKVVTFLNYVNMLCIKRNSILEEFFCTDLEKYINQFVIFITDTHITKNAERLNLKKRKREINLK